MGYVGSVQAKIKLPSNFHSEPQIGNIIK